MPEALQTVEAVLGIATALSTERDLNRLLGRISAVARDLTHAEGALLYLLDPTKQNLALEVSHTDTASVPSGLRHIGLYTDGRRNETSVAAQCLFTGRIINLPDIYAFTGYGFQDLYAFDIQRGARTRSLITAPLLGYDGLAVGVLQLTDYHEPDTGTAAAFPDSLLGLIRAFTSQAAVAVENVRLAEDKQHLIKALAQSNEKLEEENVRLRRAMETKTSRRRLIGKGRAMHQVYDLIQKVRQSDVTVLIRGETGTGKELIANEIHRTGARADGPFIAQNCAAMPEHLLESEFFGHRKGAFTGATANKMGLFEAANGGTLFLDEIGDMPLDLQAKILRVLQEGEVRPLGALESRRINVRVIAATNCDLRSMIDAGTFREDLFYRLSVFPIELPPLRERTEDLPDLLNHFLDIYCERYQKHVSGFSQAAFEALLNYGFPGNVREMSNILERAVLLCDPCGSIQPEHLPADLPRSRESDTGTEKTSPCNAPLKERVQAFEAQLISDHLRTIGWNQSQAARDLGLSRRALIEKINRYGLRRPEAG